MAKYVTIQVTRKEPPVGPTVAGEQCKKCSAALGEGELERSLQVCPHCGYQYPLPSHARVAQIADEGSVTVLYEELRPTDPLGFFDLRPYPERLAEAPLEPGLTEAVVSSACRWSSWRPPAEPVCRRAFSLSCRWPRPSSRRRYSAKHGCRSSPSS